VTPNDGHRALVELESRFGDRFTLITQNVDGLHQNAGNTAVIELHGSLREIRCTRCEHRFTSLEPLADLPLCDCGALLRPGVVWFGEHLPLEAFETAERAINRGGAVLVIGTSAVVYPAAGLILQAKQLGAFIIEVNPTGTDASYLADAILRGPAVKMLPRLASLS
jgi:NAD-dependent deacetylase